ncbi:MAG TPA: hypothetical protein VGG06_26935 [Thermoanaerobaculia bacterium]|jgi:hypothetical protein
MSDTRHSSDEIAKRGQALYDRDIRDSLDASDRGKFLILDVQTGDYELDTNEIAAVKRARAKHPDATFYVLRVGRSAAYRLGRKAVPAATAC